MNDCAFAHSGSFCQEFTINLFGRGGRTTGARETGCVRISDNLPERNMVLMKKDTVIAGSLHSAGVKVQYDEHVKRVLGNKDILAWILREAVEEYQGIPVDKIAGCIEPEIQISEAAVRPGETNTPCAGSQERLVWGNGTEDTVPGEGRIVYDIQFHTRLPQMEELRTVKQRAVKQRAVKLLINVEAQKDFYMKYEIVTRGIFYGARMISAQLDREFGESHYEELQKVYSIWICMNVPEKVGNAMTLYRMGKYDIVGALPSEKRNYDKLLVIVITLNEKVKENQRGLHRLLNVLLSPTLAFEEKKKILTGEFGIEMEREMGKEMERMCNLSEAIEERGIEKGMAEGLANGLKQGENLFAALTKVLLNAGRTDDLLRAANDGAYRQSLYEEYGIQK